MRNFLAACGVLTVFAGSPLAAEELPWCVKLDVFTKNCGFASYDECAAVAKNATSPATGVGQCIRNPDYQAPASASARPKPAPNKTTNPQR